LCTPWLIIVVSRFFDGSPAAPILGCVHSRPFWTERVLDYRRCSWSFRAPCNWSNPNPARWQASIFRQSTQNYMSMDCQERRTRPALVEPSRLF